MTSKNEERKPMSRKKVRAIRVAIIVGVIVAGGFMIVAIPQLLGYDIFFNNGGRYDASVLDDMGVIYENRPDNYDFRDGYSSSAACPWNFVHSGLDFFLNNASTFVAAAPGKIIELASKDWGAGQQNRYRMSIMLQFNGTTKIAYNLEPWTDKASDLEKQEAMITVHVGDWVSKGQSLGKFLTVNATSGHIDFGVLERNARVCPQKFFGASDLIELMAMINIFQPGWSLCYP
jgi:hypothetical protein